MLVDDVDVDTVVHHHGGVLLRAFVNGASDFGADVLRAAAAAGNGTERGGGGIVVRRRQGVVVEVERADVGHQGVDLHEVVAARVDGAHTVDGVLLAGIGRHGVVVADVAYAGVPQPQHVAALDGVQFARGVAVAAQGTVVLYVDTVQHVAAVGRGAGTDDRLDDNQLRQAAGGVVVGLVAVAVDEDTALAAVEAAGVEVVATRVGTPVGAAVDGGVEGQGTLRQRGDIAARGARLEGGIGVGASLVGVRPHRRVRNGVHADIDKHRAVHVAHVAGTVHVVHHRAGGQVDDRRRTQRGAVSVDALALDVVA